MPVVGTSPTRVSFPGLGPSIIHLFGLGVKGSGALGQHRLTRHRRSGTILEDLCARREKIPGRLAPIQRPRSLAEYAYRRLKASILSNELTPGQRLKEESLASQLGVSPTPLRQALSRLEQEELIHTIPHQGRFVAEITLKSVKDVYQVRRELEGLAIQLSTPALLQEDLEELEVLFRQTEAQIELGNYDLCFESDARLHELVVRHVQNQWLVWMLDVLHDHARRVRAFLAPMPVSAVLQSFREHRAILEALKDRDPAKARALMEEHLKHASERVAASLSRSEAAGEGQLTGAIEGQSTRR
jgi:DNA-binding GntR family transcriptional regulator